MTDYEYADERPASRDGSAGRVLMDALNRIEARLGAIERDLVDLNARIDYLGQPAQPHPEPAPRERAPRRRGGGGAIVAWLIILALLGGGAYYILSSDERMDYLTRLVTGGEPDDTASSGSAGAGSTGGGSIGGGLRGDGSAGGGTTSDDAGGATAPSGGTAPTGGTDSSAVDDPAASDGSVANESPAPSDGTDQPSIATIATPPTPGVSDSVSEGLPGDASAGPPENDQPGQADGDGQGTGAEPVVGDDGAQPSGTDDGSGAPDTDATTDVAVADTPVVLDAEDVPGNTEGEDAQGSGAEADPEIVVTETPEESAEVVAEAAQDSGIVARSLPPPEAAPLPNDAPQGLRTLVRDALAGFANSQHDLATLYAVGQGVEQDWERAAYWYQRAAEQGVVNAVYNYGVLLENGQGVAQNSGAAVEYFSRAAESGHEDAQYALGMAYARGQGVDQDLGEASQWLQAASANGRPDGAFQLGRLFEQGIDGAPDLAAAAGWYRIAATQGVESAAEALERLTGSSLDPAPQQQEAASPPVPDDTPQPRPVAPAEELSREQIRTIQERLNTLGFEAGPADGLMGQRTSSAIEAFERSVGFPVTGEPSSDLLEALEAMSEGGSNG